MNVAQRRPVTRNLVVRRWGTPQVTVGSVNEPRAMEENGVRFNEKWVYRTPPGDPPRPRERLVYWNRYDFVASFVLEADGRLVREDAQRALGGLDDRLYRPVSKPG
jgi:hypothetical protein